MGFRILLIDEGMNVKLSQNQVIGIKNNTRNSIPLEDLMLIIIENGVTLSSNIITEIGNLGIPLLFCDAKKMPICLLSSLSNHSRNSDIAHIQINMNNELKEKLWQKIIKEKITNQADCLYHFNNKDKSMHLKDLSSKVLANDKDNVEAKASRAYFLALFGNNFAREKHRDDVKNYINMLMNYGYAIIRSRVASSLSSVGLLPQFGIFHHNALNPFNLADDMMEVYRPLVDIYIKEYLNEKKDINEELISLAKEDRAYLVNILNKQINIVGELRTVSDSILVMVRSLVKSIKNNDYNFLELPKSYL